MADEPRPALGQRPAGPNGQSPRTDLDELRELLLQSDRRELEELRRKLSKVDLQPGRLAEMLPEAVLRSAREGPRLTEALLPPVEDALHTSVQRNPRRLVNAIFPVIGPAIRKSISESLRTLVDSLNQTLEHSLSLRSWKWRVEAARSGQSFAEIVLLKTLKYVFEHAFLIHRESGLLLVHASRVAAPQVDRDAMSAMLRAIQDFVRDSLPVTTDDSLEEFRVGDVNVWAEIGDDLVLAVVIRGTAPRKLRSLLQDALAKVQGSMADEIEAFDGQVEPFLTCRSDLDEFMAAAQPAPSGRRGRRTSLVTAVVLLAPLLLVTGFVVHRFLGDREFARYVRALEAEPGVVVVQQGRAGGSYHLTLLRDELAISPDEVQKAVGWSGKDLVQKEHLFQSADPALVPRRAQRVLQPPAGVDLRFDGGVLHLSGLAPASWIGDALRKAAGLPGVQAVAHDGLHASEIREYEQLCSELVRLQFAFPGHRARDADAESRLIDRVADHLRRIDALGQPLGRAPQVVLVENRVDLHQAERLLGALRERGLGHLNLRSSLEPDPDPTSEPAVSLRLIQAPGAQR